MLTHAAAPSSQLIAAVVNLTLVADYTKAHGRGWRTLFWIGTGLSILAAVVRAVLPESAAFVRAKVELRAAEARGEKVNANKQFLRELGLMLKTNWLLCIHAVLLMSGMASPVSLTLIGSWSNPSVSS